MGFSRPEGATPTTLTCRRIAAAGYRRKRAAPTRCGAPRRRRGARGGADRVHPQRRVPRERRPAPPCHSIVPWAARRGADGHATPTPPTGARPRWLRRADLRSGAGPGYAEDILDLLQTEQSSPAWHHAASGPKPIPTWCAAWSPTGTWSSITPSITDRSRASRIARRTLPGTIGGLSSRMPTRSSPAAGALDATLVWLPYGDDRRRTSPPTYSSGYTRKVGWTVDSLGWRAVRRPTLSGASAGRAGASTSFTSAARHRDPVATSSRVCATRGSASLAQRTRSCPEPSRAPAWQIGLRPDLTGRYHRLWCTILRAQYVVS